MDDDDMVRQVLGKMLTKLNYEVQFARHGEEAISLFERAMGDGQPFRAVILDLTIPGGMGGKDAVRVMRRLNPSVKALVSSGYSDDPVMADFNNYGFDGVLVKPYKLQQLSQLLAEVLSS